MKSMSMNLVSDKFADIFSGMSKSEKKQKATCFSRKKFLALFVVLIAVSPSPSSGKEARITGRVLNGFGLPLRGAEVTIEGRRFRAITNDEGIYSVQYVPGAIKLVFQKPGHTSESVRLRIAIESIYPAQDIVLYKIPGTSGIKRVNSAFCIMMGRIKSCSN